MADERDHEAGRSGAGGTTRTVQIGLSVFGGVVVQHARDPVDVDPACGDVGGDERLDPTDLERGERTVALVLRPAAVDRRRAHACLLELRSETIGAAARATEHDRRAGRRDELGGDSGPLRSVDPPEHVVRAATVGLGSTGVVTNCILLVVACEHFDGAVERRREQHRLPVLRRLIEEATHLGQESHVGHAVGFVHHHDLHLLEVERILAEEVGEASRTRDQYVDAAVEVTALGVVADTAVDRAHAQTAGRGERLELPTDLRGELTRRREDQRGRLALARLVDARDQRDPERDGLAGAGRRASAHVAAGERVGNRRRLNVEWLRDPGLGQGRDQIGGNAEIAERHNFTNCY